MYAASVLADSVGPHGIRLVTMEVTFPRPYLAEFNTHRVFSRNSESSRALPTELQIERVLNHPYIPEFRERVKGMGGGQPLQGMQRTRATSEWLRLRDEAVKTATALLKSAKDDANRVLEPFAWHTAIVTATEWDNFFALRDHPAAALPMQRIAARMRVVMDASEPRKLDWGEWHLPFVSDFEYTLIAGDQRVAPGVPIAAKVSAGRAARSSYSNHNKPETANESSARWDTLSEAGHWSPGEHPARVTTSAEWAAIVGRIDDEIQRAIYFGEKPSVAGMQFIGNFKGYVQLRKHYDGEAVFSG